MDYCKGSLVRVISGKYLGFVGSAIHIDCVDDVVNIVIQRTDMLKTEIISCDEEDVIRIFDDKDLIYSAIDRCICGSGLAIPNRIHYNYWECANLLTGRSFIDDKIVHSNVKHINPTNIQMEDNKRSTRPDRQ